MIKHKLFLKWWLAFTGILVGFTFFPSQDGWPELYVKDATKLSFVIAAIFLGMSSYCGFLTWKMSRYLDAPEKKQDSLIKIKSGAESGWFTSDLCLTIGMAGTVIGFIMMLSGFAKVDVTDTSTVQGLIKSLGVGMSTALYSTLTGLICSALLKIQYFNLTQSIFRAKIK